jgi:hypothetical protein
MLTPEQLERVPDSISTLYIALETWLIVEIAKQLKCVLEKEEETKAIRTLNKRILIKLLILQQTLKSVVDATFSRTITENFLNDKRKTHSAKFKVESLKGSKWLKDITKRGRQRLIKELLVINSRIPTASQSALFSVITEAKLAVLSGKKTYIEAISQAVKKLTENGIRVVTASGRHEQIDVVVRRAVLTHINQISVTCSLVAAQRMGFDHVEATAHAGARNTGTGYENHESWQGKIYHISDFKKVFAKLRTKMR